MMDSEITLAQGSGGEAYRELVAEVFLPAYGSDALRELGDAARCRLDAGAGLAFTTDGFVVKPLFFPGGDIGSLCVSGTVNDLAMAGAVPRYLSVAMILEAGLPIEILSRVSLSIAETARKAGVSVVTGDTKVVEKGKADGLYITTAGVGSLDGGWALPGLMPQAGDALLCSGPLASHGVAVLAAREALGFEPPIESDARPLASLVRAALTTGASVHALRDPTRGGAGATLCEWVHDGIDIVIEQEALPILPAVRSACEILGLDPLFVANEGVCLLAVPETEAERVLSALRAHPDGRFACRIGRVTEGEGHVRVETGYGTSRRLFLPRGELLPRIC